jgi:thioesterase domain-containing protein
VELASLPLTPNGKLDRKALPEPGSDRPQELEYVAPRDRLQLALSQIWQEVLDLPLVGVRDNFFEAGGNSLHVLRCVHVTNQRLQTSIAPGILFRNPTIEKLAALISEEKNIQSGSPLLRLRAGAANEREKPPMFYVHPLGGFALCYLELARRLEDSYTIYGLQYPGIEPNANLTGWGGESLETLASSYIDAIRTEFPFGPYHIGGWSLGGAIAFEMARQLQDAGETVASLVMFDPSAINIGGTTDVRLPEDGFDDSAWLINRFLLQNEDFETKYSPETKLVTMNELLEYAKTISIIPDNWDVAWLNRFTAAIRNHLNALRQYVPQTYRGRILMFKPEDRAQEIQNGSLAYGYDKIATEGVEISVIPGTHSTMLYQKGSEKVAERLLFYLEKIMD